MSEAPHGAVAQPTAQKTTHWMLPSLSQDVVRLLRPS